MRRLTRLVWIGLTNSLFLLPFFYLYLLRIPIAHYIGWYNVILSTFFWTIYAAFAILGVALEAMTARAASYVNVGLWILFALKITARYFSLWGSFAQEGRFIASYAVPLAWLIASIDFLLYRSRKELHSITT